jgi:transcriptional regulator with XRE-family HTH domain
MRPEKNLRMRELRKAFDPPLTLKELARHAGVSYATVWNLENGYDDMVKPAIMQKVCEILGVEPVTLFPSEMARWNQYSSLNPNLSASTAILNAGPISVPLGIDVLHNHRFYTLIDICPRLDFECERDVELILRQMTPNELRNLYNSCSDPEKAVMHLNRTAKRLGLKAVELRK